MASPYLKAALLTLAIALLGFYFISQLDAMRANELRASIDDLTTQTDTERALFLYSQVMGDSPEELCKYVSGTAKDRADRAYALSEKIRYYEQSNVLNSDYDRLRNQYYVANAGLYLNMLASEKYCSQKDYTTVLFFYRIKPDCPECRAQGGVLDSLRRGYPGLRVFAFPIDTDNPVVSVLLKRHGIATAPSLVIDDRTVVSGLKDESEVGKYLKQG